MMMDKLNTSSSEVKFCLHGSIQYSSGILPYQQAELKTYHAPKGGHFVQGFVLSSWQQNKQYRLDSDCWSCC